MDCQTAIETIARARAGALTPDERRDLDAHDALCSRCRLEAVLQSAVEAALTADPGPARGDDFTEGVLARIRAGERRSRPVAPAASLPARLLVRLAPAAALAAALAGFAFLEPIAGGSALLALQTWSMPHLEPGTWMLLLGTGLLVFGTYETTAFFAES
jgi:anti-sigma factor RsiW